MVELFTNGMSVWVVSRGVDESCANDSKTLVNRPDEEPSCSTSTVNIRTNDLLREDIPCVTSDECAEIHRDSHNDECAEIHHDSHSDESETLDEYSVEEVTENPNVAENQNCSPEAKTVCQILVDWALT